MFHRMVGTRMEADLGEFEDAREVVAALSEEYAAAESSDYVSRPPAGPLACRCMCAACQSADGWPARHRVLAACQSSDWTCLLACWPAGMAPVVCCVSCPPTHAGRRARQCNRPRRALTCAYACRAASPTVVLQIDRADGGAGDLAAQLASSMQLGADPRAPVRV